MLLALPNKVSFFGASLERCWSLEIFHLFERMLEWNLYSKFVAVGETMVFVIFER